MFWLAAIAGAAYDKEHHVESARLYGNVDKYAYYFIDLLIGSPIPQRVSLIADTGSAVAAFPCAACKHCGHHLDPAFDYSKSSSASWMPCGRGCMKCNKNRCTYHQGYTEGSSISGFWFQDKLRLGDSIQHNPPAVGALGCHDNENKLFYTQKANGIMGMAPSRSGRPTVLEAVFKSSGVQKKLFTMCLSEWGGKLTVGGLNQSFHRNEGVPSSITYLPMQLSSYYAISLETFKVGSQKIGGSKTAFGRTIVDSGTTYTYLPPKIYSALRNAITQACNGGKCGSPSGRNCWRTDSLKGFPTIIVVISGTDTNWYPKSYLFRKGRGNTWCFGFEDNRMTETVLGATWMLHHDVIFDLEAKKLGVVDATCPEFRVEKRPAVPNAPLPEEAGLIEPAPTGGSAPRKDVDQRDIDLYRPDASPLGVAPYEPGSLRFSGLRFGLNEWLFPRVFAALGGVAVLAGVIALLPWSEKGSLEGSAKEELE
jgi:hypothetical protein